MENIIFVILVALLDRISSDCTWNKVEVAKYMIEGAKVTLNQIGLQSMYMQVPKLGCGISCDGLNWCNAWCINPANGTCLLTNVMISPLHVTNSSDIYLCYTNQEKDFVVGSVAISSPANSGTGSRVASNIVQGIYNHNDLMTCFVPYVTANVFILIQLKKPQTIQEIRIRTQPYSYDVDLPSGATISIGTSSPIGPGNFTNFALFGTLPNPVVGQSVYSLKSSKGMKNVRYIAVQNFVNSGLALCQVIAL